MERLGLEVVDQEKKNNWTTTSLELPEELQSVEETLLKLSAILAMLEKLGLEKKRDFEVKKLHCGCQSLQRALSGLHDLPRVEAKLLGLKKKYE